LTIQPSSPALIEAATGRTLSHAELKSLSHEIASNFVSTGKKHLFLILTSNRISIIAALLAAEEAGHAVLLCDATASPAYLRKLVKLYQPEHIITPHTLVYDAGNEYQKAPIVEELQIYTRKNTPQGDIHPDLALLLTTSGSTGSPKCVRLSKINLSTNTIDIIEALGITPDDRAAAHMPLAYSYGLSVLNTHVAAGASAVLIEESMTSNKFWSALRDYKVTTLPGVPYHFNMIQRLGFSKLDLPDIKTMTQAGGAMSPDVIRHFANSLEERKGQFFVMYGQTEAGPRMTVLPADQVLHKIGSVGLALPRGKITIEEDEVIYSGANVMMGYAENRADLSLGDETKGRLATGDLGSLDQDGFLSITGRKSRIAKIDGMRVNLDEVEALASSLVPTAALDHDKRLILFTTGDAVIVRQHIADNTTVHFSRIVSRTIPALPLLANGKVDYRALEKQLP